MFWIVSTVVLIASSAVSWLLRTELRTWSCSSCVVLALVCASWFGSYGKLYQARLDMSSGLLDLCSRCVWWVGGGRWAYALAGVGGLGLGRGPGGSGLRRTRGGGGLGRTRSRSGLR